MSAAWLALLHKVMTAIFNPEHRVDKYGNLFPFGGKCMIFLGDPAQLRPVGAATYDEGEAPHTSGKGPSQNIQRNTKDQRLCTRSISYPTASSSIKRSKTPVFLTIYAIAYVKESRMRTIWTCSPCNEDASQVCWQTMAFTMRTICVQCTIGTSYGMSVLHQFHHVGCSSARHSAPDQHGYQAIIDVLSSLPRRSYNYAPDVLCVAEGCDVLWSTMSMWLQVSSTVSMSQLHVRMRRAIIENSG